MKLLVTGASGYLGTHLCARLEREHHEVSRLSTSNGDLRDPNALNQFNGQKFNRIYHLAAWTQAGDFCLKHSGDQWVINQQINTHVLSWWLERQPQAKLIAMGSSCCYAPEADLHEENFMKSEPIDSLFTYAMTKRMLYAGLMALNRQYGLNYLCLVPSTLYGSGYHLAGRQMHFIFDIIRKIVDAKQNGTEVVLWGDGYQKRELIYMDDFLDAMFYLSGHVQNELVNIGGGKEYTIREFASFICEIVGYDQELIRYDPSRYVGARSKVLIIEKLFSLMPSFQHTPLQKGLRQTIEWYLNARQSIQV
ncbi:MAG: NAD-dependent epimerase/dehydratase family protein [Kiritimatiellae bacterium]|nr:NAD-dependent epimerase/dehydratase family protein [Kiritimatiellia bacterium]